MAEDFGARAAGVRRHRAACWRLAANAFYAVVAVAAVAGGVVLLRRPDPARRGLFLVVAGAAQLVSPLATFGDPRFKMPIYPTLAICAAVAVVAAVGPPPGTPAGRLATTGATAGRRTPAARRRRRRRRPAASACHRRGRP